MPVDDAPWKSIATRKQSEQLSRIPQEWRLQSPPPNSFLDVRSIPQTCGILTSQELNITENYDATSLALAIRSGKLSAEAVTTAFCKRAAVAQQCVNCLTEIFFDEAIKRAKWLDAEFKRTGRTVGPLHGVPVSLKDGFKIKGHDATIGFASLAFQPATENSVLVDILLEAGAVLYCKTNIPQTLMSLDSVNNLFGRTLNPRDKRVTAGGSSGGEGALLAMHGSVLGVGTDVGGSIRIPAMCNALYGIKPSSNRVPSTGMQTPTKDGSAAVGLLFSAGPMATSLRDCQLFLRMVADANPWARDPSVAFGGWDTQGSLQKKPLIGVIRTDGLITPLPPIRKIISETVEKLRASRVEVIEIDAPAFKKCQALANTFFSIDGGNHVLDILDSTREPLIPWLRPRLARKPPLSLDKIVEAHAQRAALQKEMLEIWRDPETGREVDAIILPVAPHPTPPVDRWGGVSYTSSFVLLDYPAGTLPIRRCVEADLGGEIEGDVLGRWDEMNRGLWDEKTVDRSLYVGTELCVQVITPPMQERRLVEAMGLIDGVMKQRGDRANL